MDTWVLIDQLVAERGWKAAHQDELDGETVILFRIDGNRLMVTFTPDATSVIVRGRQLAQTGGPGGTFDPALAALAATLSYRYDIQLGIDLSDGEVAARAEIELAGVAEHLHLDLLDRGVDRFLLRLSRVAGHLAEQHPASDQRVQIALLAGSPDLSA